MDNDGAHYCLARLTAGYAGLRLDEANISTWIEVLLRFERPVGLAAVVRCIEESDRFPSVHRFLEIAQGESRRLAMARQREIEEGGADPLGRPVCGLCQGVGSVFTEPDQVEAYMASREQEQAHLEPEHRADLSALRAAIENSVHPCPRCRHVEYHRWKRGHYRTDHHCSDCYDLAHGGSEARAVRQRLEQEADGCACHLESARV